MNKRDNLIITPIPAASQIVQKQDKITLVDSLSTGRDIIELRIHRFCRFL